MSTAIIMAYLPFILIGLVVSIFIAVGIGFFSDRFAFGVQE